MPTTIETRIRRSAAKKVRVQITGRSRSSGGFDVTYPDPEFPNTDGGYHHRTVNVPSKKQALTILLIAARVMPELVFKIVPHRAPSKASVWCDACQCKHVKPVTEAEHNELQCLKVWKEPKA